MPVRGPGQAAERVGRGAGQKTLSSVVITETITLLSIHWPKGLLGHHRGRSLQPRVRRPGGAPSAAGRRSWGSAAGPDRQLCWPERPAPAQQQHRVMASAVKAMGDVDPRVAGLATAISGSPWRASMPVLEHAVDQQDHEDHRRVRGRVAVLVAARRRLVGLGDQDLGGPPGSPPDQEDDVEHVEGPHHREHHRRHQRGAQGNGVMLFSCCQRVAPSTSAASYMSRGIDCRAGSPPS